LNGTVQTSVVGGLTIPLEDGHHHLTLVLGSAHN